MARPSYYLLAFGLDNYDVFPGIYFAFFAIKQRATVHAGFVKLHCHRILDIYLDTLFV